MFLLRVSSAWSVATYRSERKDELNTKATLNSFIRFAQKEYEYFCIPESPDCAQIQGRANSAMVFHAELAMTLKMGYKGGLWDTENYHSPPK